METFKNCKMDVMLNKSLVGKAPPEWTQDNWRRYYKAFRRTTLTPYVLAGMIWQGYSFTPVYSGGRRLEENFTIACHVAFDFDSDGAALDSLIAPGSFAWTFASFAYSTPSSTKDHPKSRVVFCIPGGIETAEDVRILYQAVAAEFAREGAKTDPACKDPLRLYYGSPNCDLRGNWAALLPETVDYLVSRYQRENPPPRQVVDTTTGVLPPSDDFIEQRVNGLLERIIDAPDGEKHHTLNKMAYTLGGLVGGGHISQAKAIAKAEAAIAANGRAKDLHAAQKTIETAVQRGAEKPITLERRYKLDMDELL